MTRDEAMQVLKRNEDAIRALGVTRLALFGSTVRDEAKSASDVDVLVDLDEERTLPRFDLLDLRVYLSDLLGREVEVTTRKGLKPFLKDNILAEAVEIFPEFGKRNETRKGRPMPKRSPRQSLQDMLDAISEIEQFVKGQSFDDYLAQVLLRAGVERKVEIISEASRRVPEDLKGKHAGVPWTKIAAIGNVLRHGYKDVDDQKIWAIATEHLAPLRRAVEAMIREVDAREGR
jgi:uncharacterized protein with HEPN domain/predicted nucleotidyltransferase